MPTPAELNATFQANKQAAVAARTPVNTSAANYGKGVNGNVTPPTPTSIPTPPVNNGGNISANGTSTGLNAPVTPPVVPTNTPTNGTTGRMDYSTNPNGTYIPNNPVTPPSGTDSSPGIMTYEELSPTMKAFYDDPNNWLAKEQFDIKATQGKEAIAKELMDREKDVVEWKKEAAYTQGQDANATAQRAITQNANERQAQDTLNKATQNTYYSAISPVTSSAQQTAAGSQLREMAKGVDDMVQLYGLQNDAYSKQTAENARRIQLDLDTKLGQVLSDKLKALDNGVANGQIATPAQLDRIFQENSDAILKEVPELTNFAVQQMHDLTTNYMNTQKDLRTQQDTYNKNAQTISPVSGVTGHATDMNGKAILSTDGQPIPFPKNAPYPPQLMNGGTQVMISSLKDDGTVQYNIQDVQNPQATALAQSYLEQNIPLDKIPDNLRNQVIQLATQQGKQVQYSTTQGGTTTSNASADSNVTINNMNGGDLMKALASGNYNGQKFFGVYASGDPTGANRAAQYNKNVGIGVDGILAKYPGSKISADMINATAQKYNIDPVMVATIMEMDSSMGTKGLGSRNNNPGNVGQFDSLGTNGVKGYGSMQEGVDAVGANLHSRMNALAPMAAANYKPENDSNLSPISTQNGTLYVDNKTGQQMTAEQAQAKFGGDTNVSTDVHSSNLTKDAEDVLFGRNTLQNIRATMGRNKDAAKDMENLRSMIREKDSTFDFVDSDAGAKFFGSTYGQKAIAAVDSVLPNVDKIVDLSNQVSRIGVAGVDAMLQKGAIQLGDKKVANFHEAQKLIADEIGIALGAGTVSDMKLQLGFDVTDPSLSPEVFASNMSIVRDFLNNRKSSITNQRYASPTTTQTGTSGGEATVTTASNSGTPGNSASI